LESIHLSSNVVEIGVGAFQKCRALKYLGLNESLRKIGEYAFQECDSLSPVLLNEGLESIGAFAFARCTSFLTKIQLPSTVVRIGDRACCGNTLFIYNGKGEVPMDAKFVKFHPSVTKVPAYAFAGYSELIRVLLNEGLQEIGNEAFHNCESLTDIEFPSTVVEIRGNAFLNCTKLSHVSLNERGRIPSIDDVFGGCDSLQHVTVPCVPMRLKSIGDGGRADILEKIRLTPNIEMVGGNLFICAPAEGSGYGFREIQNGLDEILGLITYYELKEATTLFELICNQR